MRTVELLTLAYFAYVSILAIGRPLAAGRRLQALALAALSVLVVLTVARSAPPIVRDWLPALYILLGYWISGLFFVRPMARWETRLADLDRRALRTPAGRALGRATAPLESALELAYLSVHLLVPIGFLIAYLSPQAVDVDRYWTVVVAAELACYAMLPWIQTRPPREVDRDDPARAAGSLRQANLQVLRYGSIHANTVPSGHAAGAVATALAVSSVDLPLGVLLGAWALAIMVGSFAGRYHYVADAILGAAVGVASWLLTSLVWGARAG
jgi:hypothetical protein